MVCDKATDDPREVDSRAWICCRAIFMVAGRRQYLELYMQEWPKRYDRDALAEVRRFAAEVAEEHGIEVSIG